jgi:hypothetical protein
MTEEKSPPSSTQAKKGIDPELVGIAGSMEPSTNRSGGNVSQDKSVVLRNVHWESPFD